MGKHSLFQDKSKLLSQVRAQESVIQGLRMERKLWGEELAQQGIFQLFIAIFLSTKFLLSFLSELY
jgi:hypothetical protein